MKKYFFLILILFKISSAKSQHTLLLPDSTVSFGKHSIIDSNKAELAVETLHGLESKISFYTNYAFPSTNRVRINAGSISGYGYGFPVNRKSGILYNAERHEIRAKSLHSNNTFSSIDVNGYYGNITFHANNGLGVSSFQSFVRLGEDIDVPAIKLKKITSGCTTSANSGYPSGEVTVAHNLAAAKIIGAEVLVEYSPNYFVKAGNDLFGYQFDITIAPNGILIRNVAGTASAEIRSKPCKILLTYEL